MAALCNLLLVMALYTLSRLFFYDINRDLCVGISNAHLYELLLGGTRFDLTALLYLNSLYLILMLLPLKIRGNRVYQKTAVWCYWIPNAIGIVANCMDMVYFRFTDRSDMEKLRDSIERLFDAWTSNALNVKKSQCSEALRRVIPEDEIRCYYEIEVNRGKPHMIHLDRKLVTYPDSLL